VKKYNMEGGIMIKDSNMERPLYPRTVIFQDKCEEGKIKVEMGITTNDNMSVGVGYSYDQNMCVPQ
jgi:hypothetical protein